MFSNDFFANRFLHIYKLFSFRKSTMILKSNDKALNLIGKSDLNKKLYIKGLLI